MAGMLAQASPAQYAVLQHLPLENLPSGVTANSLRVPAPPTFRLLYHTNFSEAYITYRFSGQQSAPRRLRMHHQPDCSGLMLAHLPAPGPDSSLEFSITGATYDSANSTLSTLSTMVRPGNGSQGTAAGSSVRWCAIAPCSACSSGTRSVPMFGLV
jgi:hypothetical protein